MPYELYENADALCIVGNCFLDDLTTAKPLVVDGDLVARHVAAPHITLNHGSLLCPLIECDYVHAEILGVCVDGCVLRPGWSWQWLRPFVTLPDEASWGSETSIERVITLFLHPALVRDIHPIERLLLRVSDRPTCLRARVLFHAALEELRAADAFTPLGERVAEAMLAHPDLPKDWRW